MPTDKPRLTVAQLETIMEKAEGKSVTLHPDGSVSVDMDDAAEEVSQVVVRDLSDVLAEQEPTDVERAAELYGIVLEKLRSRGVVSDEGKHFTWEPAVTEAGTPYQHIRWGPVGIADTYHSDPIPAIPGSPFVGGVEARPGDKQIADLIVALLNWFPDREEYPTKKETADAD